MKTELQQLDEKHVQDLDSIFANSPLQVKRQSLSQEQANANTVADSRFEREMRTPGGHGAVTPGKKAEDRGWIDTKFKAENTSTLVHEVTEDRRRAGLNPATPTW